MTTKKETIPAQATHPGILIKDELDATPDLNQRQLAKELDVKPSFLNEIINGKRPITPDFAVSLEAALGISAEYWIRFQSQYDIDQARVKEKNIERVKNIGLWNEIKKYVPVRYFYKQGYLSDGDTLGKDIETVKNIYSVEDIDQIASNFSCFNEAQHSYYRKSEKLEIDDRNIFAWSTLAQHEAKSQKTGSFDFDVMDELCSQLNHIFFENSDTKEKVQAVLNQFGIKFLLIDKLEKTPIDGFTFWSDNNPAIALTLRHNRIDNFAFTIMHEIAHIDLHLRNDKEINFMDFTKKLSADKYEKEADVYAQEKLIPKVVWENIVDNHFPLNDDKIIALGEQYKINPSIILGRMCYEKNNYARNTIIDKTLK